MRIYKTYKRKYEQPLYHNSKCSMHEEDYICGIRSSEVFYKSHIISYIN